MLRMSASPPLSVCLPSLKHTQSIALKPGGGAYVIILTSPATKANKTPHKKGAGSMSEETEAF